MNLDLYKDQLYEILVTSCEEAILNLKTKIKKDIDIFDNLIMFEANLRLYRRKEANGTINNDELNLSVNKVRKALISLIKNLKDDDFINSLYQKKKIGEPKKIIFKDKLSESFCKKRDWDNLISIGSWKFDKKKGEIRGKGIYKYLLSRNEYGNRNFTITTEIKFNEISERSFNAGIILGWIDDPKNMNRRYLNLLFNKNKIRLEGIGLYGGEDLKDFTHFDNGVPFEINFDKKYDFAISIFNNEITVNIDSIPAYYSITVDHNLVGRIGLRPWRSEMIISSFDINEI